MKELTEILKERRPNLSVSSLYSYSSTLRGLHKRVFNDKEMELDDFNNVKLIMKDLETKPATVRKTVLAVLFVLTENPAYQTQMKEDIKTYKEETNKQEMSEKQKKSFLTQEQIANKFKDLEKQAKALYKKGNLTPKEKQQIQDYILVALTSGIFIPPRRSLDFVKMKLNNIENNDNFIQKNKFHFNTFKGSNKKGTQIIDIPKPLMNILNKWIAINETDFLLHDLNGKIMSAIKINQHLNKIFGAGFSVNNLRHSYLSEKYQSTIALENDMSKTMEAMGSSTDQSKIYINKLG